MPRVHAQKARKDIYQTGLRVPDAKTKSKTRLDRSKPANENDRVIVKAGETYYYWTFRYGGKRISTTYPKQSQLTQSTYKQTCYGILEGLNDVEPTDFEELESLKADAIQAAEDLRDETQESRDNMPEALQDAPTGELLGERVEALENFISELEAIDCEDPNDEEQDADEIIANKLNELQGCDLEIN